MKKVAIFLVILLPFPFLFAQIKKSERHLPSEVKIEPNSKNIKWTLANPYGIQMDEAGDIWHAGKVVDALVIKAGGLIAASETSGIYLIAENGNSISLSRDWDNPNVQCLAYGPDNESHVYAGCSNKGIKGTPPLLYVTDISKKVPLLQPWKVIKVPAETGSIHQILVQPKLRRILLACDGGVYWSKIPKGNSADVYNWNRASGLPQGAFFGITAGPQNSVIVSPLKANISTGHFGIFYGLWKNTAADTASINFNRSIIKGFNEHNMGRASIVSFESNPVIAYALSMDGNGTPNAILRSENGGKSWTRTVGNISCPWVSGDKNIANREITGNDEAGGIIHRITVSKRDPNLISFGNLWAYYSLDGGNNWEFIGGCDWRQVPALHPDVHAVQFDHNDRMIILSDGGIATTSDFGKTVNSHYNQKLTNLQWYSTYVTRNFYGRFDVSYQIPGLLGGGLQDNGNVYSIIEPVPTPWKHLDGGDGGAGMFMRTGNFIRANMNTSIMWNSKWNSVSKSLSGAEIIPFRDSRKLPWVHFNLVGLQCDVVNSPQFRNASGQLMYVVAGQPGMLYGLFANPDGSDLHWELVASWLNKGERVDAVASATGKQVFISINGLNGTRVWRITPSQKEISKLGGGIGSGFESGIIDELGNMPEAILPNSTEDTKQLLINRLFAESDKVLYALHNNYNTGKGAVLRTDDGGITWLKLTGLPDEGFYGLETDWTVNPNIVYVCTDKRVYRSKDAGKFWTVASQGLPERPHCADLSFVIDPDGSRYLYLSTYGWSVWRAKLN